MGLDAPMYLKTYESNNMITPLSDIEIQKLKQKGIEIRIHDINSKTLYEVVTSLMGIQELLSYINVYALPKIGNELNFEFFSDFLKNEVPLRELYVQYQPLCRNQTLDDKGLSSAHHLILYIPNKAPVVWFSLIQDENTALQSSVTSHNELMGGALILPEDTKKISWLFTLKLENSEKSKLLEHNRLWFEKVLVLTGRNS